MAEVIGGPAGYAMVNPTQGNPMGAALANVENSAFRYREEKREEQQIKAQQARQLQEDRRRDMEDAYKFSKDNPFVATGTGLDAVNRQSYMNAKNTAAKAYADYLKTGDMKQRAVYENAVASVNNISAFPKQINALKEDWVKNAGNYNPESLKRKAAFLDQIASGQIVQTNDANGNPKYTVFDRDESGNVNKLAYKDINSDQLLKLLTPEKAFNIDGKDGFIDLFKKNIGKERKVIEGKGLNAVEKIYYPGAEEVANIMVDDAINDESKMYETLQRIGLDPEDKSNYTNEKVKEAASNYLKRTLMATAPTDTSAKPSTALEMLSLARTKEANDERQRAIDNARKNREEKRKEKELRSKEAKIGGAKTIAKEGFTDNGVKVTVSDKIIPVSDKGTKNETGFKNALKEVVVHKDGTLTYSFEQDNPEDWVLTAEGKAKVSKDPSYKLTVSDYLPQKPRKANFKTSGKGAKANEVEIGILNITNPETGELFESTQESDDFFRRKAGVAEKKSAVPKKEYSNVTETSKGTIGVLNGKWYDIKTGKEIK